MAAKVYYERHSLATALIPYLTGKGWTLPPAREGFQSEENIVLPMVAVTFLTRRYIEAQLGRSITTEKSYNRQIQIDAYAESEPKAMAIVDDIMDFLDEMFIVIIDPNNVSLGNLYCRDSETINGENPPPLMANARVLRWRGIVTATLRSDYF